MFKQNNIKKGEKGFTLIELLVVAAIIGILLALAIPNLLKARISANEANAAKMMLTLRDAEGEFFEQDLNADLVRNYTNIIGDGATADSLRYPDPAAAFDESDALVDSGFETIDAGVGATDCAGTPTRAGYCISNDLPGSGANAVANGEDDYGWKATYSSYNKNGRNSYAVYSDGFIRCDLTTLAAGDPGVFANVDRTDGGCQ